MTPRTARRPTLLLIVLLAACAGSRKPAPTTSGPSSTPEAPWRSLADAPETRREDVAEVIHGARVEDPYRWLEAGDAPEVKAWMDAQDARCRRALAALPRREELARRFRELFYVDSITAPLHRGSRHFYTRRRADLEKAVVYHREGEGAEEKVLLDPNAMSEDGSIALSGWFPSEDGRLVAYKVSANNADRATMRIRDVDAGKDLEGEVIDDARYAWASWTPDSRGFYYTWLPADGSVPEPELPGRAEVRFHEVGTDPSGDRVVVGAIGDPTRFLSGVVSRDGRWLILYVHHGWSRADVYYRDMEAPAPEARSGGSSPVEDAGFLPLVVGQDALYDVTPWRGFHYVRTNEGAPRYRLLRVEAASPGPARWQEIVPERADATLESAEVVGEHLVLVYMHDAANEMEVRTLEGALVRKVELPGIGTVKGMVGEPDEDDAYYELSSFTMMPRIFRTSVRDGTTSLWATIDYPADLSAMTTEQVWYASKDGTRVSMFLIHRKDMARDGSTPALLTGYGGFDIALTPRFGASHVVWLEQGGLVAIPNLRGGGEYGEEWHRAGMLERKQNVFDDFIAAAEYLVAERYTRPGRLAIAGGSNGGLLVGAAMVQRPDLFRAVVCDVPLLDMVRYHLVGAGKTWISEYGSADDPALFRALLGYSPYHHVTKGARYPSLLVLSADSDDRVDPMHARKFTAAVQWASGSGRPVLLRIERRAGHGGADMRRSAVEESADIFAFLLAELGGE